MAERRSLRRTLLTGCLIGLLITPGLLGGQEAAPEGPQAPEPTPAAPAPAIAYEVEFTGELGDALRDLLQGVSETVRLADRPPSSLVRLRRRAEDDVARLEQALRSRGYYGAEVDFRIEREREPALVVFEAQPGPIYRFGEIATELTSPAPDLRLPTPEQVGLAAGEPAAAQQVLDAEQEFLGQIQDQGYPLASLGERRAVVDHDTRTMDLTLRVKPGPRAEFGPVRISGLEDVEESYVRYRLPWQEGELITPERLAAGRTALFETGLFSSVRVRPAPSLDDGGELPVSVQLEERPHRSIGLGVRYRTDEGPGGSISWEHRNFFGAGERLELELDASGIGYLVEGDFRKPDFIVRDQSLLANSSIAAVDTEAFDSRSIGASIGLERLLAPGTTASIGVAFRAAEIDSVTDEDTESFGLLSLPATFDWDRSDDLLNPTSGGRLSVRNEPFADTFGNGVVFNKTRAGYTQYLELLEQPQLVLAGRAVLGTLFGAERSEVPADERFYAGGGGSVRGFGFQLAGPLDADGDPRGGRSLLELAGELRTRFTETLGAVAFVDAGSAFESSVPDFDEEVLIGAGVGVRYFSPIGPLRFDIAFPINRRDVDDAFQLYVSFGQAF